MTDSTESKTSKASWHTRLRQLHAGKAKTTTEPNHGDEPAQQTVFDQFLATVQQRMQPEGRAQHQFHMNQYLCSLLPQDITLADLALGWQALTQDRADDSSSVASRRKTCAELAAIAAPFIEASGGTDGDGTLSGAIRAWQVWLATSQTSLDPRVRALRETSARELRELEELQAATRHVQE
jgi:hypothetical protein